jgi:hypothetical protein
MLSTLVTILSAVSLLGSVSPAPVERLSGSDLAGQEVLLLPTALTGDAEVPGPGDPDGVGMAVIAPDPGQSQVCWDILVIGIAPPTAAHIHAGEADVAGDIVFTLTSPTEGTVSGCAAADAAFIEALTSNPQGYYVNVHNEEYPDGALRGQLGE